MCESGSNRNHRAEFQPSHLAHISFARNGRLAVGRPAHTHGRQFSEIVAVGRRTGLKSQGTAVNLAHQVADLLLPPSCAFKQAAL